LPFVVKFFNMYTSHQFNVPWMMSCFAVDASEAGSPTGSPTAACLDSPTASTAAAQQQQRKRQYKVHGMDPYDYWSLIKSL
jgi:hypothetical protein